jgi:hypothetical protein
VGIEGFQSFVDYILLKLHFNNLDFIWNESTRYTKVKQSTFDGRNDKSQFIKFERMNRFERRRWIDHLVSAFLFDSSIWIGDVMMDDTIAYHEARLKKVGALESLFQRECELIEFYLVDNQINLQSALLTTGIKDPIITRIKGISLESLTLLHQMTGWADLWFPINPLFKHRRMLIHKYRSLLRLPERDYLRIETTYQHLAQI